MVNLSGVCSQCDRPSNFDVCLRCHELNALRTEAADLRERLKFVRNITKYYRVEPDGSRWTALDRATDRRCRDWRRE
jgi:hypothetical protein